MYILGASDHNSSELMGELALEVTLSIVCSCMEVPFYEKMTVSGKDPFSLGVPCILPYLVTISYCGSPWMVNVGCCMPITRNWVV